jgi:hypothetical protein
MSHLLDSEWAFYPFSGEEDNYSFRARIVPSAVGVPTAVGVPMAVGAPPAVGVLIVNEGNYPT